MKKLIIITSFIFMFTFFFGCKAQTNENNKINNEDTENSETTKGEKLKIADYFPINENVRYVYEGSGNEYAAFNVYSDYTAENKVQQRVDNGGTVVAVVMELKDGKVTKLLSRPEAYYRENLLNQNAEDGEILLMEPLESGTSWTLKDSRTRKITNTAADITTSLGSYKAIEVLTEGPSGKTFHYYAKDIGLVKVVSISKGLEVTSSLSKIEKNSSLVQSIRFFYPDINSEKIYYKDKEISFKTNDITKDIFTKAYKDVIASNLHQVFSGNTKINSMYLNRDGMVYIDLNQAFITEMNTGALGETLILQSIANTFGRYYNSEKVILTIDNKLYESGHVVMKKGEYLKVKYDKALEIK